MVTMESGPIEIKPGEAGRLIMLFPYSSERVAKIKTVTGRRWHQQEKHWTVPHTNGAIAHLKRIFSGETTEVDPSLDARQALRQEQRTPETSSAMLDRLGTALRARHYGAGPSRRMAIGSDGLPAFIMAVSLPRWLNRRSIGF
jgi:hypothetical protein